MSIKSGDITKGMYILYREGPHAVLDREFVNPGKGSSFVRLRLKNVKTGDLFKDVVFKANESVEEATVTERKVQYLYFENNTFFFMDSNTFEQYEVNAKGFEEKRLYLEENETVGVVFWEEVAIDIVLPRKKVFIVKEAPDAIKGDTATQVTKVCVCTTGLEVKTPAFIKEGEKILVNTDTGEYLERVNDK